MKWKIFKFLWFRNAIFAFHVGCRLLLVSLSRSIFRHSIKFLPAFDSFKRLRWRKMSEFLRLESTTEWICENCLPSTSTCRHDEREKSLNRFQRVAMTAEMQLSLVKEWKAFFLSMSPEKIKALTLTSPNEAEEHRPHPPDPWKIEDQKIKFCFKCLTQNNAEIRMASTNAKQIAFFLSLNL